jgi:carboxypeptidase PM20D1
MKRGLKYFLWAILLLLAIMLISTFLTSSKQPHVKFIGKAPEDTSAVRRLSEILRFKTISYDDSPNGQAKLVALEQLYNWMELSYPLVFSTAKVEKIGHSLLITLNGKNTSLLPALFVAHLDVVPVDTMVRTDWPYGPFNGVVKNDTIYGRGVLDDKSIATALLEAMEKQIKSGFKSNKTIIIAFGQDEESGGMEGAVRIATHLKNKGIKAAFICDEGFGVMEGLVPGIDKPVAIIGITEKGYMTVKLSVTIPGGHSAMPKKSNATGILAEALSTIEKESFGETFCKPQKLFFRYIAPEVSPLYRFLFSNLWITSPAVKMVLNGNEKTAATIKTTHAITVIKAGQKVNSLPGTAEGYVNFRILPGQTMKDILKTLRELVNPLVQISVVGDRNDPLSISPTSGFAWETIVNTIHECTENVVTAPAMVITGTDCKNYKEISDYIYRFTPLRFNNQNLGGMHGKNERLAVNNYFEVIRYYEVLFQKL